MQTMKAIVKLEPEPGIWMDQVPFPRIGHNDVLIKVSKTAICGTDIHIWQWDDWAQRTVPVPLVTGRRWKAIPGDVLADEIAERLLRTTRTLEGVLS